MNKYGSMKTILINNNAAIKRLKHTINMKISIIH